jgi:segregation and condensation protein B
MTVQTETDEPVVTAEATPAAQEESAQEAIEGDAIRDAIEEEGIEQEPAETAPLVTRVEALLFVASEPLTIKQLAKLTKAEETEVATALSKLSEDYTDRGIVVREVAGGYRFATASAARDAVEAYLLPPRTSLSAPALETLAIVAHMQPVTKTEIEAIRGVNSDSVVNTLLDRNLIAEAGRKDVIGRPMQYISTAFFLESFGLNSLSDLPPLELEPGQPLELNLLAPPAETPEE